MEDKNWGNDWTETKPLRGRKKIDKHKTEKQIYKIKWFIFFSD